MQLLCIVCVIANHFILLLDEATSSIDTRTEQLVQKAFDTIMNAEFTWLLPTGSLPSKAPYFLFRDGSILERGTHDELLGPRRFTPALRESV